MSGAKVVDIFCLNCQEVTTHTPSTNGYVACTICDTRATAPPRFPGLSHLEVLASNVPPANELVAGLPETWKSWLAQQLTVKVASRGPRTRPRGSVRPGRLLVAGRQPRERAAAHPGVRPPPRVHRRPADPLAPERGPRPEPRRDRGATRRDRARGPGARRSRLALQLPAGDQAQGRGRRRRSRPAQGRSLRPDRLRPLPGRSLPLADRGEPSRRGYGSVFKAAVVRWGIYLDRQGDTVFVEARGNNLTGLPRTAAIWNADELELRLVDPTTPSDSLADRIDGFLRRNPGAATSAVTAGVAGEGQHDPRPPPRRRSLPDRAPGAVREAPQHELLGARRRRPRPAQGEVTTSARRWADVGPPLSPVTRRSTSARGRWGGTYYVPPPSGTTVQFFGDRLSRFIPYDEVMLDPPEWTQAWRPRLS